LTAARHNRAMPGWAGQAARLALALACLAAAAGMLPALTRRRAALLGHNTAALERQAPVLPVVNTIVLGGFRGLLADLLWLRLTYLQQEGRTMELVQLADWITKLEPHASQVWAFHAWNLAYNVSILMPAPADRWRWVRSGITLLRDDGIRLNPGDRRLYWELAWLFQHKIGGRSDSAHAYYKTRWHETMRDLVGGARPDWDRLASDAEARRRLRADAGLALETMRMLDWEYGPLDWTSADAQAVYWAHAGKAGATAGQALMCDRMILRSLARPFLTGTGRPDPEALPTLLAACDAAMQRHAAHPTLANLYRNILVGAVLRFHRHGDTETAQALFERLRQRFALPAAITTFDQFTAAFE
jgi:hypothetical protein